MARPNVSVQIVDNSFIVSGFEAGSPHISGMLSSANPSLVDIFGTTADKNINYMTVTSPGQWISLLNGTTYGGATGSGPTGDWKTEWYSAYNYLLYGGSLIISDDTISLFDTSIALDTVFTSQISDTHATFVTSIAAERSDVIGILGVTYNGYTGGSVPSGVTAFPSVAGSASGDNLYLVGGEKVTLGLSNATVGQNFVTIPLAADAAGCFARTDRVSNRWFSPAGTTRGRILNVVRLIKNPKELEQDRLYDDGDINSIIGIPGQGTFLFGDKTKANDTSTLSRVNVVRLIAYIKRILGNTAKSVLFEVNDEITRSAFTNAANGFLQVIKDGRGLFDYKVVCDETNNPSNIIDANQFVADVYIKPTKSINYVKLVITNLNTDAAL